ncbi:MAG TPA: hypothetical protein VGG23_02465 [Acidimicrobiales bacterium]
MDGTAEQGPPSENYLVDLKNSFHTPPSAANARRCRVSRRGAATGSRA